MMYHGPTEGAEPYFGHLDYKLPKGESVADWLIDISSGRLEPENTVAITRETSVRMLKNKISGKEEIEVLKHPKTASGERKGKHLIRQSVITDGNCVGKKGVTTGKIVR